MRSRATGSGREAPKGATEIAGAAAFIVFRIAQNALKTMRKANFELPAGARYFAFLSEFLVFLTLCADRIAHRRGDDAWRVEFTTALANRVGAVPRRQRGRAAAGGDAPEECKRRFIALVNARSPDYAECGFDDNGPDYTFLRCLGHRVADGDGGARSDLGGAAGDRLRGARGRRDAAAGDGRVCSTPVRAPARSSSIGLGE